MLRVKAVGCHVAQNHVGTEVNVPRPRQCSMPHTHLSEQRGVVADGLKDRACKQWPYVSLQRRAVGETQPQTMTTKWDGLLNSQHSNTRLLKALERRFILFYGGGAIR